MGGGNRALEIEVVPGGDMSQHLEALLSPLLPSIFIIMCSLRRPCVRRRHELAALHYLFAVHDTIATAAAAPGAAEVAALPAREHRGAASAEVAVFYPAARSVVTALAAIVPAMQLCRRCGTVCCGF